ncbi:EAL domain-containing protein [Paenibacillus sp. YYML68]|uniref:EAL domain-containing protein n=1 Tax=Paenibacillus sp. YYML68 TaxID=2909250 RepID=UPI002491917C|nr:EAL domain-containing protein [Paenibacillus sp. YYML68]
MISFIILLAAHLIPISVLFFIAMETLQRDRKGLLNRIAAVFFFLTIVLLLGNMLTSIVQLPFAEAFVYISVFIPAYLIMCCVILFFAELTEMKRIWGHRLIQALSLMPLLAVMVTLYWKPEQLIQIDSIGMWSYQTAQPMLLGMTLGAAVYTIVLSSIFIISCLRSADHTAIKLRRKQLKTVLIGLGFGGMWVVVLTMLRGLQLVPEMMRVVDFSLFGVMIYALFMRYAMIKYDLLPSIERKYQVLYELSPMAILLLDRDGYIRELNSEAQAMLKLSKPKDKSNLTRLSSYMELVAEPVEADDRRKGSHEPMFKGEYKVNLGNGSLKYVRADSEAIHTAGERFQCVVLLDITGMKEAEEQIRHMAYFDKLTELPNRYMMQRKLEEHLLHGMKFDAPFSMMVLDLDGFKKVNDTQGHHVGDRLLEHVAALLRGAALPNMTVARLSGDEFAILVPGLSGLDRIQAYCQELYQRFQQPIVYEGKSHYISVSIGVSSFPEHGQTAEQLQQHADLAMYHAKKSGRNRAVIFDPSIHHEERERFRMDGWIRKGLKQGEFALHYQPQVHIRSGKMIGAEALIRWNHPERGLISPGLFIPLAEESGTIVDIGYWVLETACEQLRDWLEAGYEPICLSINLSAKQFQDPKFPQVLAETLHRTGIDPSLLCLEITERTAMLEQEQSNVLCQEIMALGVKLSIDDFGTGYSSLVLLKQLPVHSIKIDRSFVMEMESNENDRAIIKAMIAMSHSLGKKVVAEGVEQRGQWDMLELLGCDEVQGYVVSRPVAAEQFVRFLDHKNKPHNRSNAAG